MKWYYPESILTRCPCRDCPVPPLPSAPLPERRCSSMGSYDERGEVDVRAGRVGLLGAISWPATQAVRQPLLLLLLPLFAGVYAAGRVDASAFPDGAAWIGTLAPVAMLLLVSVTYRLVGVACGAVSGAPFEQLRIAVLKLPILLFTVVLVAVTALLPMALGMVLLSGVWVALAQWFGLLVALALYAHVAVALPAAVIHNNGPLEAIQRAWTLSRPALFPLLGLVAVGAAVGAPFEILLRDPAHSQLYALAGGLWLGIWHVALARFYVGLQQRAL